MQSTTTRRMPRRQGNDARVSPEVLLRESIDASGAAFTAIRDGAAREIIGWPCGPGPPDSPGWQLLELFLELRDCVARLFVFLLEIGKIQARFLALRLR